jgi:hypothetical protein
VIDHAELALLFAIGRVFQPDDVYVPRPAAFQDKVERLGHLLAGVNSTIAVLLSAADLT